MVSTMSGPIPPHPYYDKADPQSYLNMPQPRVRPEAEQYARQGQGNGGILLHVEGQRPPSAFNSFKKKAEPKDHMKDNVRRMRQISKAAKQREGESKQPMKALWKSEKYGTVQSKVRQDLENRCSSGLSITGLRIDHEDGPEAPRPHSASYLRAHSRGGWNPVSKSRPGSASSRSASVEPPEDKLTVPKAQSAREVKLKRNEIDFVRANGRAARYGELKRAPSATALDDLKKKQESDISNYQKGAVPKYLQNRKKQWEDEEVERIRSIPDPDMPPGHKLMTTDEREDTLRKLRHSEKELLSQLAHMPIRSDTPRLRRSKDEIEKKLHEIDEAIKIFSRPKVFVKLDE